MNNSEIRRNPTKVEEIVHCPGGEFGRISSVGGTFAEKLVTVENESGEIIYENADASAFHVADIEISSKFQIRRYNLMGYTIGAMCMFKGNEDHPLEIKVMEWKPLRLQMMFITHDLLRPENPPIKTYNHRYIPLFIDESLVEGDAVFNPENTGLKYRLEMNLVEKENVNGWTNAGSIFEFSTKERAMNEIEGIIARLKLRRISSVMGVHFKYFKYPGWTLTVDKLNGELYIKLHKVYERGAWPCFFPTACHAAKAAKLVTPKEVSRALGYTIDYLNVEL